MAHPERGMVSRAFLLRVALSAGLLAILAWQVDWHAMRADLAQVQLGYVAAALLVYVAAQLLSAYRWKVLLRPLQAPIGWGRVTALYYVGMFFNLFLPTMIGGDAVKLFYVSSETGGVTRGAVSILMDRNLGLMTLLLLALAVTVVFGIELPRLPLLPLLSLLVAGFLLANLLLFHGRTFDLLRRILGRWRVPRVFETIDTAHDALKTYRMNPRAVILALVLSLLFDFALMYFNYLDALGIGHPVELKYFFAFIPIISVVSMLPITLYGLGLREYSVVFLFGQVGMPREAAVLLAILALIIPAIASLPGGIIYLFFRRK